MKPKKIVKKSVILLLFVSLLLLVNPLSATAKDYTQITSQTCDATTACPAGLECYSFPGIGLRCGQPDPCDYYECGASSQCLISASYPGTVTCGGQSGTGQQNINDSTATSYDLITGKTQTITINARQVLLNQDSTTGSVGQLKEGGVSVEYNGELSTRAEKLFMKTAAGQKQIGISPREALAASQTPNLPSVEKILLKEEAKNPIYYVLGSKSAKFLGIFSVKMKIITNINAESGQVVSVKKPWWSFLART